MPIKLNRQLIQPATTLYAQTITVANCTGAGTTITTTASFAGVEVGDTIVGTGSSGTVVSINPNLQSLVATASSTSSANSLTFNKGAARTLTTGGIYCYAARQVGFYIVATNTNQLSAAAYTWSSDFGANYVAADATHLESNQSASSADLTKTRVFSVSPRTISSGSGVLDYMYSTHVKLVLSGTTGTDTNITGLAVNAVAFYRDTGDYFRVDMSK